MAGPELHASPRVGPSILPRSSEAARFDTGPADRCVSFVDQPGPYPLMALLGEWSQPRPPSPAASVRRSTVSDDRCRGVTHRSRQFAAAWCRLPVARYNEEMSSGAPASGSRTALDMDHPGHELPVHRIPNIGPTVTVKFFDADSATPGPRMIDVCNDVNAIAVVEQCEGRMVTGR
jgi:hypothetical protein